MGFAGGRGLSSRTLANNPTVCGPAHRQAEIGPIGWNGGRNRPIPADEPDTVQPIGIGTVPGWLDALELRGRALTVGDQEVLLGPSALALFRRLTATEAVVPKRELLACMPEGGDEHALEVAMSRLRRTLGSAGLITTVVKRGYRLNAARIPG